MACYVTVFVCEPRSDWYFSLTWDKVCSLFYTQSVSWHSIYSWRWCHHCVVLKNFPRTWHSLCSLSKLSLSALFLRYILYQVLWMKNRVKGGNPLDTSVAAAATVSCTHTSANKGQLQITSVAQAVLTCGLLCRLTCVVHQSGCNRPLLWIMCSLMQC